MGKDNLENWTKSLELELRGNILPYWERIKIPEGFCGELNNRNEPTQGATIGLVMVARLLWTYSRAYYKLGDLKYLNYAEYAREYLLRVFKDSEHGGFAWEANELGEVINSKKFCYGQAFVVYALSEHARAARSTESQLMAMDLFECLEDKCWDKNNGGYLECFERDWSPSVEMKLGAGDSNAPKTMNNHLHLIEAYSNLLKVTGDQAVKESCIRLIRVILDRIVVPGEDRFGLYFDMDWVYLDNVVSYGHDIEGSWLMWEAAEIIGDESLLAETREISLRMAERVLEQGVAVDGSVLDEQHLGEDVPNTRTWWPQAEGMVGFFNAYQMTGDDSFLKASEGAWRFLSNHIIDREFGEWVWGVDEHGTPLDLAKAGPWKAPYHNGRACLEMMERIQYGVISSLAAEEK